MRLPHGWRSKSGNATPLSWLTTNPKGLNNTPGLMIWDSLCLQLLP